MACDCVRANECVCVYVCDCVRANVYVCVCWVYVYVHYTSLLYIFCVAVHCGKQEIISSVC